MIVFQPDLIKSIGLKFTLPEAKNVITTLFSRKIIPVLFNGNGENEDIDELCNRNAELLEVLEKVTCCIQFHMFCSVFSVDFKYWDLIFCQMKYFL